MTPRYLMAVAALLLPAMAHGQAGAHPPIPRDQAKWFAKATDFYPASAMRAGAEGTVDYVLTIDPNARIVACRIPATSGNADLDATTCRIMARYARFDPATDAAGRTVAGEWSGRWKWTLPR